MTIELRRLISSPGGQGRPVFEGRNEKLIYIRLGGILIRTNTCGERTSPREKGGLQ